MSNKSLKSSQILRAHMTYFRRPSHNYSMDGVGNVLFASFLQFNTRRKFLYIDRDFAHFQQIGIYIKLS